MDLEKLNRIIKLREIALDLAEKRHLFHIQKEGKFSSNLEKICNKIHEISMDTNAEIELLEIIKYDVMCLGDYLPKTKKLRSKMTINLLGV